MKNFLPGLLLFLAIPAHAQNGIDHDLSVVEFKSALDSMPGAVVLDLRTTEEIKKEGMIANARQLDYFSKEFEDKIDKLDRSKVYLLYCAGGGRSGETKEMMEQKGFVSVYHLEQGFGAWKKAKMPILPPQVD